MISISIEKLRRFAEGNPMYGLRQVGDLLELRAVAPPLHEAASVTEGQAAGGGVAEVVVVFKVEGPRAVPVEAYVDSSDGRRALSLEEIEWWLQVLDQMY